MRLLTKDWENSLTLLTSDISKPRTLNRGILLAQIVLLKCPREALSDLSEQSMMVIIYIVLLKKISASGLHFALLCVKGKKSTAVAA